MKPKPHTFYNTKDHEPPANTWLIVRNRTGFDIGAKFDGRRWRDGVGQFMKAPRQWQIWNRSW